VTAGMIQTCNGNGENCTASTTNQGKNSKGVYKIDETNDGQGTRRLSIGSSNFDTTVTEDNRAGAYESTTFTRTKADNDRDITAK